MPLTSDGPTTSWKLGGNLLVPALTIKFFPTFRCARCIRCCVARVLEVLNHRKELRTMHLCNGRISRSSITAAVLVAISGTATAAAPTVDSESIDEIVV